MNILITGNTGFIGRYLTPALIAQHHNIIGINTILKSLSLETCHSKM
jgi:nucleoside-diphosphate-sugar epimerase